MIGFFFQGEGGIRGSSVTGVQTCALPISANQRDGRRLLVRSRRARPREVGGHPVGLQRLPEARGFVVRKGAVKGKSVDFGGRRFFKKKLESCLCINVYLRLSYDGTLRVID